MLPKNRNVCNDTMQYGAACIVVYFKCDKVKRMTYWSVIIDIKVAWVFSMWSLKESIFSKILWIYVLGELYPTADDGKFMLSIIIYKMKSTDLCLCIICTQMVFCEAFRNQANHICQNTLHQFQHLILSKIRKVVSLDQWISYCARLAGHLYRAQSAQLAQELHIFFFE